jgi:hypothetical protein
MRGKTIALLTLMMVGPVAFDVKASAQTTTQSDDLPKYEIGAEFTSLTKQPDYSGGGHTEIGAGARFTFNLNRTIALEAVGNFFPRNCSFCGRLGNNSGNITQGLFGVKVGKRFEKWGIFAKARPGFVSFSKGDVQFVPTGPGTFDISQRRSTNFAFDLGGGVEFYTSRHLVTRFDAGGTFINYRGRNLNLPSFDNTGGVILIPFHLPGVTKLNFQFSAGVGYRF